jgi:hypothetical protein
MGLKEKLREFCNKNKMLSRNYDKLTWYKSKLQTAFIPDEVFAKLIYKKRTGKELNLDNPETYDDKLWYLKLHNRDPLLTACSDKYRVREYVEQCGLGHILNELYGVYDNARDIDFTQFKQPVFLKCNHGSGENIIYYPDKRFDQDDFVKRFNFILRQNSYTKSREWNYKNIKPKIVAEKVLRDSEGKLPLDYKFLCFNGEPKLMYLLLNTCDESGKHRSSGRYLNIYDMDYNLIELAIDLPIFRGMNSEKPLAFEQMKNYAHILSKPFELCRIDFLVCNNNIYFGEITFYDNGGFNVIQPLEWDLRIGSWININNIKRSGTL